MKNMFSKYKNKGKGIGKGKSNRHKSDRYQKTESSGRVNDEGKHPSTSQNKTSHKLVQNSNPIHSMDPEVLPDRKRENYGTTTDRLQSETFLRNDSVMADLMWKSVHPIDERIPRLI